MGKPRSCVLYIHSSVYIMVHCIYTSCQYPWTQWMGESLKQVLYLPSSKRANSPYVLCIHQTTKALWCHIMEGNFQLFCAPLLMLFIPLCNGEISREKLNFPWNLQFFKLTSSKIIVVSETTFHWTNLPSLFSSLTLLLLFPCLRRLPRGREISRRGRRTWRDSVQFYGKTTSLPSLPSAPPPSNPVSTSTSTSRSRPLSDGRCGHFSVSWYVSKNTPIF